MIQDFSRVDERISTAGIVLAILFFWVCLLGLLFLLMKERTVSGHINVTVKSGGFYHLTQVPATHAGSAAWVQQQVGYIQSVANNAPSA